MLQNSHLLNEQEGYEILSGDLQLSLLRRLEKIYIYDPSRTSGVDYQQNSNGGKQLVVKSDLSVHKILQKFLVSIKSLPRQFYPRLPKRFALLCNDTDVTGRHE